MNEWVDDDNIGGADCGGYGPWYVECMEGLNDMWTLVVLIVLGVALVGSIVFAFWGTREREIK